MTSIPNRFSFRTSEMAHSLRAPESTLLNPLAGVLRLVVTISDSKIRFRRIIFFLILSFRGSDLEFVLR